jgi:putative hemolysin
MTIIPPTATTIPIDTKKPYLKPGTSEIKPFERPMANMANPSAVWAKQQGYNYEITTDALGNQSGVVNIPGQGQVDAWSAYKQIIKPQPPKAVGGFVSVSPNAKVGLANLGITNQQEYVNYMHPKANIKPNTPFHQSQKGFKQVANPFISRGRI